MKRHEFHPSVLRAYDIRGVVGDTLSIDDAMSLGAAFGTAIRQRGGSSVAVGMDGRASSPALAAALCDGLAAAGILVKKIGLGPTPMLYFAQRALAADGGIMVTGSHNPPDHNGFKMVMGTESIHGEAIADLAQIAARGTYALGKGAVSEHAVSEPYVTRLLADAALERPMTVAWDMGNGAVGPTLMRLTERLPGRHLHLNENVDGRFPAHHPDPADPATLVQLQETVLAEGCDIGIAFDGDGDRIGVVDSRGRIVWGDQLLALLAREVIEESPGATVIADVKASQVLFDEIEHLGGTPIMWRTGHSLIKAKMAETGAALAGEMSGHIYFADRYFGFDDALYAAIRVLNMTSRAAGGIASLRDSLPQSYATPEIRVPVEGDRKFRIVADVGAQLEKEAANVASIDGVRVQTKDGWWLMRASNTQEAIVVRCESGSEDGLRRLCVAIAERLCAHAIPIARLDGLLGTMGGEARERVAMVG